MQDVLLKGDLIQDSMMIEIMEAELQKEKYENGFLLDGFPRTSVQAEVLDAFLEKKGSKIDAVLTIEVSDKEVIQRLASRRYCEDCKAVYNILTNPPKVEGICDKCDGKLVQRGDDNPKVIQNRLDVYSRLNSALLAYYEKKGVLIRINGEQEIPAVFEEVKNSLKAS